LALLLAAAVLGAGCEEASKRGSSDDDEEAETTVSTGAGASTSGPGSGGGVDPAAPKFVTLEADVSTLYEGDSALITAVLSDPDGLGDIVGGSLADDGGGSYGSFIPSGPPGSYQLEVSWNDIQALTGIDFAYGASTSRTLVASFSDAANHVATQQLSIELACSSGWAACNGSCLDTMNDDDNCGSCDNECGADLCVSFSYCSSGSCVGGEETDCSWMDDVCVVGDCNSSNGQCQAQALPNNTSCDDDDPCTTADVCSAGLCSGTPVMGGGVLLSEDFSDNLAGWTLGIEWQIGPAMVSTGHSAHNADPGSDHSTTTDNGVAGVVIGGNASTAIHSAYYLTSPPVNAAGVQGSLTLTFYRWLNSDYTPYMDNVVEVFNGTSWVSLWQSGGSATVDSSWVQQSYDLTSYKSSALRVRFGHSVGSTSAYTVSSWNIDDLVITSGSSCP
jgi:hypothetical protein